MSDERERARCDHQNQELRRRIVSNGASHYVMQCLTCGTQVRAVKKGAPEVRRLATLPPEYDPDLPRRYWDEHFANARERWQQADETWLESYNEYMQSEEWDARRAARLRIDQGRCQAQMRGCDGQATHVHHLSYRYFRNEPLFDLISVCRACHEQLHRRPQWPVIRHASAEGETMDD